jgi:hypothetical protein
LVLGVLHTRRSSFAASGAWSTATLAAVMLAAPVVAEAFIRLRSTPWDVDTLFYAPAVAVVPFALMPAFVWFVLPYPSRRLSLALALLSAAAAGAILMHEHPRHRGLLPQPRLSEIVVSHRMQAQEPDRQWAELVDFRVRPVDTAWCRVYVTLIAPAPPTHDVSLRMRGAVPDAATDRLPEHQRDRGYAEWFIPVPASAFPKAPKTLMVWADVTMHDVPYNLTVDIVRTNAREPDITQWPLFHIAPFNPFDQRDTCALANPGFETPPASGDWTIAPGSASRIAHEADVTYRGTGALRIEPGAHYTLVRQDIQSLASLACRRITFSVKARASEPMSARIMLTLGGAKFYSPYHPGDGGWHTLTVSATAPFDWNLTAMSVNLVHAGIPQRPVVFDEAQLDIE